MQQAILDRFGSNIRAQEAHAKLLTISQGKRSVRDYTSEFETLLGRLSTRDETTWKNMYIWGLQPHLAEAVALKYPTTIAQAAGHAEQIELAKKTSQRPNLGIWEHVPLEISVDEEDPRLDLEHLLKDEAEETLE